MYKYPIIVFEGIEASGKSTNLDCASKYLKKIKRKFIKIREPEEGTLDAPHVPLNYCSHIPIRWIGRYDMEHSF